jgi:hypothetical protein
MVLLFDLDGDDKIERLTVVFDTYPVRHPFGASDGAVAPQNSDEAGDKG